MGPPAGGPFFQRRSRRPHLFAPPAAHRGGCGRTPRRPGGVSLAPAGRSSVQPRCLTDRRMKYLSIATLIAVACLAAGGGALAGEQPVLTAPAATARAGAGALVTSTASSTVVQRQPRPGSCHARGTGLFSLPDPVARRGRSTQRSRRPTSLRRSATPATPKRSVRRSPSPKPRSAPACTPTAIAGRCTTTSTTTSFRWSSAVPATMSATCGPSPAQAPIPRTSSNTASALASATAR